MVLKLTAYVATEQDTLGGRILKLDITIRTTEENRFIGGARCAPTRRAGVEFLELLVTRQAISDDQLVQLVGQLTEQLPDLPLD